jgi:hypothetical protein
MWYIISTLKNNESLETCSFFIAKWYSKKNIKDDFKDDLLLDLTVYNAFYNTELPVVNIMTDKEWNDWIKKYPRFVDCVSIRNVGQYHDIINEVEKSLPLNKRLLSAEQVHQIVDDLCVKFNI